MSSDSGHTIHSEQVASPAETSLSVAFPSPGAGGRFFYVAYTSDPSSGSGVFDDGRRQGQARYSHFTVA